MYPLSKDAQYVHKNPTTMHKFEVSHLRTVVISSRNIEFLTTSHERKLQSTASRDVEKTKSLRDLLDKRKHTSQ